MSNKLIVIVDDEEDLLDLLAYNFSRAGFRVEAFQRAKPALDYISTHHPDAILSDWMMPGMSGLEFCRQLRSSAKTLKVPFIMVTCLTEKEAVAQAFKEGVNEYIVKPIKMTDLVQRISQLLDPGAAA